VTARCDSLKAASILFLGDEVRQGFGKSSVGYFSVDQACREANLQLVCPSRLANCTGPS
jgi:hypothetical protein